PKTHQEQEKEMSCQDRLSQWEHARVNGFCPLKQTPNLGSGPLERGDRVGGISWDYASQCSASVGAGSRRTTGLSALTRVVSGCRAKKWPQATGPGRVELFCAPAGLGVTVMERR